MINMLRGKSPGEFLTTPKIVNNLIVFMTVIIIVYTCTLLLSMKLILSIIVNNTAY